VVELLTAHGCPEGPASGQLSGLLSSSSSTLNRRKTMLNMSTTSSSSTNLIGKLEQGI